MTVSTVIPATAFALSVDAGTSVLALAYTVYFFACKYIDISAMMELDALILRVSPPFELKSAIITGEVLGELELFGLKRSLHAPTRESTVFIRTTIERVKSYELILIWANAEADGAVALRSRIDYFPSYQVARSRSCRVVNDPYRVGSSTWSLASIYDFAPYRFALHRSDQTH